MDDRWIDIARDRRISIGSNVLQLASEPENWIQRRVETLEVSSRRLVRRTVGVDLVLPATEERNHLRLGGDEGAPLIVPLGMLRKAQLIDFDLSEGDVPRMLVRSQINTIIAAGALWGIAVFVDDVDVLAADAALPWFERIAGPKVDDASLAFGELFERGTNLPTEVRRIAQAASTRDTAEQLRERYLLLVELPETGKRHRLIRFATDQVVAEPDHGRWQEQMGLWPSRITFDAPGASQAASYHAEVTVPAGCAICGLTLTDGSDPVEVASQTLGGRATLYPNATVADSADLQVSVQHDRSFFFAPAVVVSALLSSVVIAGAIVVLAGGRPEATAVTLLLSGFGAMTGLVIRYGEPTLTRELHHSARALLVFVMVMALVAASTAALGATNTTLGLVWLGCGLVSVPPAILFWVAYRAAPRQVSS